MPDGSASSDLPAVVEERIRVEVPDRGERIIACLETAAWLLEPAHSNDSDRDLRMAESAAYNLREALDAVVMGRDPAEGGLPAIREAWTRLQLAPQDTDDERKARAQLDQVLERVMADRDRGSERARQLLTYLRAQSGAEPLQGQLDPVSQYSRLLNDVNNSLHTACDHSTALDLFDRTINWFLRMFTAPDSQVQVILDLAAAPYAGPEQIDQLKAAIANPHHLRLLFGHLQDPAWLTALDEAGLVPSPQDGQLWPVAALVDSLGRTYPREVAQLLQRLVTDTRSIEQAQHAAVDFELLRVATHLGEAAHPIVSEIVRRHGEVRAVRTMGTQVALDADPSSPTVVHVARAVVGRERRSDREWGVGDLLDRLDAGLTADNMRERTRFLAGKIRALMVEPYARFTADIASLRVGVEHEREMNIVLAHHLVRVLRHSRALGASTAKLQEWIGDIPGPIGERITCQLLAEATDVPLDQRIAHLAIRLRSSTATGDDRDLMQAILSCEPDPCQLAPLRAEIGTPSPNPEPSGAPDPYPDDWARMWRWSAILPPELLADWQEPLRQVSSTHGTPTAAGLDHRPDRFAAMFVQSPYTQEELAALTPLEAASQVASWRPDSTGFAQPVGARELARTLEELVSANLNDWTDNPIEMVTLLREPIYILHYLQALTSGAAQIGDRAPAILDAAEYCRTTRPAPTPLGPDDGYNYEATWDGVDAAIVDLIGALANADGQLGDRSEWVWQRVIEATTDHPDPAEADLRDIFGDHDALQSAINRPWSRGLQAAVALARWEAAHAGPIRPQFTALLDEVIDVDGAVGLEYRAILAAHRPLLEKLIPAWLDDRADVIFRRNGHGPATLDLTLKYSRPTTWLLDRFRTEIYAAAQRRTDNALSHLLAATLNEHPGYTIAEVIKQLHRDEDILRAAAEQVPALLQQADADSPVLAVGVRFWQALLDANREIVPPAVLRGTGRWVYVTALEGDQWAGPTLQTLELTGGQIDYAIEVSNRCSAAPPDETTTQILTLLADKGEPWERSYVQDRAVELLRRTSAAQRDSTTFKRLRTRLLELGRHEVVDILDCQADQPE